MSARSHLSRLIYLLLPVLTWSACNGDDDAVGSSGSGGKAGSAAKGGSSGKGGSSAGKGGTAGSNAGKGGKGGGAGAAATGGKSGTGGAGSGALGGTGAFAGSSGESGTAGEGATGGTTAPGGNGGEAGESAGAGGEGAGRDRLAEDVQTIVFIYAENRSFDGLFGNFPGAHGLSEVLDGTGTPTAAYVPQKDRDGTTTLPTLPKTWNGATASGNPTQIPEAMTGGLANKPFALETGFVTSGGDPLTTADVTRDMAHRFFENQMEINGGTNDMFAAWLDAGGITMGHFSAENSALYALATQYVLADNFFEGAFGGSFLNHQYLICACAPSVPAQFVASNLPSVNVLGAANAKGVPQLATNSSSPASALDGPPSFKTGNIAPLDYFGPGDGYRAVNTMQPAFQPSGNAPVANATDLRYANAGAATTLPIQTQTTIGDLLSAKGVSWAWYATAWDAASADGQQASTATRTVIYAPSSPRGNPDFQAHHHPFNYYAAMDPATHPDARAQHLKDYSVLLTDIDQGHLPNVTFYKPTGYVNLHPGYANVDDGDAHLADLVARLKASPQWAHMVIVITVDEYGGQWDHVAPPKGDLLGPGTRVPAVIVSPFAKAGTVDHTQYDTASILRLVTRRFGVPALPGLKQRDDALVANGKPKMGDLTQALDLP